MLLSSLVKQAASILDRGQRQRIYDQMNAIHHDDAPMIFLWFYSELYAVQPWIKHFVPPVIFNGQRWTDVTIDRSPASGKK